MSKLTCEEYKDFYDKFTKSPYGMVYVTLLNKITEICDGFNDKKIDVRDDEAFKNLISFSKETFKVLKDMDEMMAKIDSEKAAELKEKARQAGVTSLESMIKKAHKK